MGSWGRITEELKFEVTRGIYVEIVLNFRERTVRMIEMPHFQYIYYSSTIIGAISLIFQICTVQSLDCTNLKYERKIIEKRMTSSICTKFAHF